MLSLDLLNEKGFFVFGLHFKHLYKALHVGHVFWTLLALPLALSKPIVKPSSQLLFLQHFLQSVVTALVKK